MGKIRTIRSEQADLEGYVVGLSEWVQSDKLRTLVAEKVLNNPTHKIQCTGLHAWPFPGALLRLLYKMDRQQVQQQGPQTGTALHGSYLMDLPSPDLSSLSLLLRTCCSNSRGQCCWEEGRKTVNHVVAEESHRGASDSSLEENRRIHHLLSAAPA